MVLSRRLNLCALLMTLVARAAMAQTHAPLAEQRDEVSYLRGPYNTAFYDRENEAFRIGAAIHFSHGKQHDVLLRRPFSEHERTDAEFDAESMDFVRNLRARTEPSMELYAPYTARAAWRVFRAIDWTHQLHEQTYDIMASRRIAWADKASWTERSLDYYLHKNDVGFSCAPLDVTMRRAAVMMKPYFTYFRNYYPKSNNFFYAAHWWHPVIYEAQMIGGNGPGQDEAVRQTDETSYREVLRQRPQRMILLREAAPRYSRMAPGVSNAFDNLHMFHGIVYDICAYPEWTIEQKRDELYRVIKAMSYQPGDEALARKFPLPHPDVDPRVYADWMKGTEGEMSHIMMEMHEEMMPLMMPDGTSMTPEMHERMTAAMKMKLAPGMQEGETPGSLHDAMMALMPNMRMDPASMAPGGTPQKMIDAMLKGWQEKHGDMPDAPPMPMDTEPSLADVPLPAPAAPWAVSPLVAPPVHGKGH